MLEGKGLAEIARDAAVKKAGEFGEKTLDKSKEILSRFNPFNKKKKEDTTKLGGGVVKKMLGKKDKSKQEPELKSNQATKISKIMDEERSNGTTKRAKSNKKDSLKTTVAPKGPTKLQKGESASNVLAKIYALINEDFETTKLHDELAKNFEEDKKAKEEKRHKELIEALKEIGQTATPVDNKGKEKEEGGGFFADLLKMIEKWKEGLMEMLGPIFDIVKNFGSVLINVAKFFLTNPIGLGLLAGATLMTLLYRDKDPEATNKGIQNAGKADGGLGEAIMDAKSDEASQRRAVLLRKAHEDGTIKASWWEFKKAGKEENDYLKSIGFDTQTGLTQKDRDNGFNAVDEEGNPYFSKSRKKSATQSSSDSSETTSSAAGTPGAPGASATPAAAGTPGAPGSPGASATPAAAGTPGAPGASATPVSTTGSSATPVKKSDMSATPSSTPSASTVPPVKSPGDSATPASSSIPTLPTASTAAPIPTPKQSDVKLQQATKENADLNLDKNAGGSEISSPVVVNNSNTTNAPPKAGMTTPESMYNSDSSFRDSLKASFSRMLG